MGMRDQMIVKEINRINAEQAAEESRNPLAAYSTRQLKAELARRDRQRLQFPVSNGDLSKKIFF